jgi:uncharacterized ferritin-like protein (DUF455 family)
MRDLLEVKDFYRNVNSVALDRALQTCQQIILEPTIAKKIELGLTLGPLLETVSRTTSRIKEIADQPLLQTSMTPPRTRDAASDNIPGKAAKLAEELKAHVLFGPEISVLAQIKENFPASTHSADWPGQDALPALPARDPVLQRSPNKPFRFPQDGSIIADKSNYLGFLFYVLVDVEISAMEVCSYMALKYRDMPDDFVFDMARQIWDEARHAAYILDIYTAHGGELTTFPYTNTVIDRFNAASNLLEGLIVQQLLQESNAVENNILLARDLAQAGREEEALSFLVINNDEALHARIGFKWIAYLAEENSWPSDYLFARTMAMGRKVGLPLFGMGTWTDIIREAIDTPEWLMHKKTYFGELFGPPRAASPEMIYR